MNRLALYSAALLVIAACAGTAVAQDRTLAAAAGDRYVISAKAGGVNFVEGTAAVARPQGRSGRLLKGDELEVGDRVSTADDGRVEILLNPGSYLRLGGNTAFEFKTTSLDDLVLRLDRGTAIFEVFASDEFRVTVETPKVNYSLLETGVYRVELAEGQAPRLEVWKGKAQVGESDTIVKGGKAATGADASVAVAKFDRDERDPLDAWSRERSKDLSKALASLQRRDMRTALMQSFMGRRWNLFNSFGLWVLDPIYGYCFLPFDYGWSSPYGFGYGRYLGWYRMPRVIYYPPSAGGGNPGGGSNPGPSNPGPGPVTRSSRGAEPPFVRMQGGSRFPSSGNGDAAPPSTFPSSSPPVFVPSPGAATTKSGGETKRP